VTTTVTTANNGRSLHRKLAQVMHEVGRIPKNGTAPQAMGGYKFVQVGDATDAIRKALADQVITMMPTGVRVVGQVDRPTKSGGSMTTVDLITTWTITDGESGESIQIESFGAGADGGDKYSGKASTSAMKYALLTGFLLSTGDDTEASNLPEQRPRGSGVVGTKANPAPVFDDGSLVGTVELSKDSPDFLPHVSPEGGTLTFKLVSPRGGIKVNVYGKLAYDLSMEKDDVVGKLATCWGRVRDDFFMSKGHKVTYQILDLERFRCGALELPLPDEPLDEPDDSVPLLGEAASEELGLLA
jgi:ERF superfamily protein